MAALVPGVQPFAAWTGDYTLAADQESITIGASPTTPVATPWYGMGAALARIQWDGTAAGTVQVRSSDARPNRTDADAPIQPDDSEWLYDYDAAEGTVPTSQGWSKTGTVAAGGVSGGVYTMDYTGVAYFNRTMALSSSADVTVLRLGVMPKTGHDGAFEVWCQFASIGYKLSLQGSAFGANARKILVNGDLVDGLTWNYDEWLDLVMVIRNTVATLHYRVRGSNTRTDLIGLTPVATPMSTAGANVLLFGDVATGVGGLVDIDHLGVWQGTEWETVTDGDTSFAVPSQRQYVQVRGWENGTVTGMDLASDLTPPGNPSGPEAAAVGASAIGGNCTTTASGAAAYWVECLDADNADAVVADRWALEPSATFRGLTVPGNYKLRFSSASDDGVRGSASVTTGSTAVPVSAGALIGPTAPTPTLGWITYPRPTAAWL